MSTGFWYLATPYTRYPLGRDEAFRMAARVAGRLVLRGVHVFSPIAHSHPIAELGGIDPCDGAKWRHADAPFVEAARGCIVYQARGWDTSAGVAHEIAEFTRAGKPVVYMRAERWPEIPPELLP